MSKALPIAVAVVLGGAALVPVYYATQHPTTEVGRKADKNASPIQKISYVLGYEVAQQTPPELDTKAFVQGIHDARSKQPSAYTQEDLKAAVAAYEKSYNKKCSIKKNQSKQVQLLNLQMHNSLLKTKLKLG